MKVTINLLLTVIVTLTGMTAGAKDLLKQVSKSTSQNTTKGSGGQITGISGHGGSCD